MASLTSAMDNIPYYILVAHIHITLFIITIKVFKLNTIFKYTKGWAAIYMATQHN